MLVDLRGRVAMVTGAGRGIGRELSRRLVAEGARLVAIDVDEVGLAQLDHELSEAGGDVLTQVVDVTVAEQLDAVVARAVERFGRLDVLVNNAGVTATAPVELLDESAWRRCFDINVTGVFLASRAVVPTMKRQGFGRIINASSFAAIVPSVAHAAYGSSKAAVAHFGRALAGELGPWGITVNSYAPGMIPTAMNRFAEREQADQDRLLDTLTIRRWGSPDDVADLVCFLASDRAGYITGQLIDVSGGKLATQVPSVAYAYAADADGGTIL